MDLPEWLDADQWQDFVEYRLKEASKKTFGEIAQKRMLAKLERLHAQGYDVTECIDHSIQAGWLGVFGHDDYKRQKRPNYHAVTKLEVVPVADKETAKAGIAAARRAAK